MADIQLSSLHPHLKQDHENVNSIRQQKELHFMQFDVAGIISQTQGYSDQSLSTV